MSPFAKFADDFVFRLILLLPLMLRLFLFETVVFFCLHGNDLTAMMCACMWFGQEMADLWENIRKSAEHAGGFWQ